MEFSGMLKYISYGMMGMSVWGFLKALYDENWKGAVISGLLLSLLVITTFFYKPDVSVSP